MKALGIVRRIDDLGRVVIPKEVRDSQGWAAGQAMEMFLDDDKLVIQAYGKEQEKQEILQQLNDVLKNTNNEEVVKVVQRTIDFIGK